MDYFRGAATQRGYGLAGILGSIARSVLPIVSRVGRQALKTVGKTALRTGTRIAKDVLSGGDIKSSASKRSRQAGMELIDMAMNNKSPKSAFINKPPSAPRKKKGVVGLIKCAVGKINLVFSRNNCRGLR